MDGCNRIKPGLVKLPKSLSTPMVMVATGTGLAPLMSIILSRAHLCEGSEEAMGETMLFFGCR